MQRVGKCHHHNCSGSCGKVGYFYKSEHLKVIACFRGYHLLDSSQYWGHGTARFDVLRQFTSICPMNALKKRQQNKYQAIKVITSLQKNIQPVDKEEMGLIAEEVISILRARRIISSKEMRRRMKSSDVPNSGLQLYKLAVRIIYTDMCNNNSDAVWVMNTIEVTAYSACKTSAKVWWHGNCEYENQQNSFDSGQCRFSNSSICSFQSPVYKYKGVAPVDTQTFETMKKLYVLLNTPILGAYDFDKAVYDGVMTVLMVGNRLIEKDPCGTPPPEIWIYILSLLLCSDFIANVYNSQYLDIELLMCSEKETKSIYLSIETAERIPGYYSELGPENEAKVSEIVAEKLSGKYLSYIWKPRDYPYVNLSIRTALSIESGGYGIHTNTPEIDRIKLNNYRPTSSCLKDHDLKFTDMETAFGRRYEHFTCDVCLSRFRDCGPFSWRCKECDYDVCSECATVEEVDT